MTIQTYLTSNEETLTGLEAILTHQHTEGGETIQSGDYTIENMTGGPLSHILHRTKDKDDSFNDAVWTKMGCFLKDIIGNYDIYLMYKPNEVCGIIAVME
jgi:hypothetical protein